MRAIARDLGPLLGCFGHVDALRRTRVGPFVEADAVALAALGRRPTDAGRRCCRSRRAWREVPCVVVDRNAAARLRRGQPVLLRGRDAPIERRGLCAPAAAC